MAVKWSLRLGSHGRIKVVVQAYKNNPFTQKQHSICPRVVSGTALEYDKGGTIPGTQVDTFSSGQPL